MRSYLRRAMSQYDIPCLGMADEQGYGVNRYGFVDMTSAAVVVGNLGLGCALDKIVTPAHRRRD